MQDETVLSTLDEWSIGHEYLRDEALMQRIDERVAALQPPTLEEPPNLPNYPLYAAILAVIFLGVSAVEKYIPTELPPEPTPRKKNAFLCGVVLVVYVLALQFLGATYAIATTAMIFIVGGLVSEWDRSRFRTLAEIAIITGFGSEFLFTQIFTVLLP